MSRFAPEKDRNVSRREIPDIPSRLKSRTFALLLPTIERFNTQDGREMLRDLLPALALVETSKDRAAIGPEVHPHRLAFVTPHGLPQNGEVAGFLW